MTLTFTFSCIIDAPLDQAVFFSFFLLNVSSLGVAAGIMQGKCTPLSNSSLCLSLFSWCGTAVHLCTCSDRTTASLSSLEILTAAASQIRTPFHSESKRLTQYNWGLFGMLTPIDVAVFQFLMPWFILAFHLSRLMSFLLTFLCKLFNADQTQQMQQYCSPSCKATYLLIYITFF